MTRLPRADLLLRGLLPLLLGWVLACREPPSAEPSPGAGQSTGAEAAAMSALPAAPAAAPELELGCAAAPRLLPSSSSERSLLHSRGSTEGAADTSRSPLSGCREWSAGPEAWHLLDLSAFSTPVEVHAVVDASFDALLELRRGACGDTASLDCDRAQGTAATGSSVAALLAPGEYWLLVDGADAASRGDFQLQVELDPAPGLCTGALANASCDTAWPLEPLARQTVLLDEACAPRRDDGDAVLWYELDLSREPQPVLVQAAAWTLSEAAVQQLRWYAVEPSGECGAELGASVFSRGLGRTNAELSALLRPARYRLELGLRGAGQRRAGLQLDIDRETCATGGGAGQRAALIDPALPQQVFHGNTACNTSQRTPWCAEVDAPEQPYRLDLRSAQRTVRARITVLVDGLGFPPVLLLERGDAGTAGAGAVYCDARIQAFEGPPRLDLTLPPDLYQIVVDGAEPGAAGPYRLLVELEPGASSSCVDARIDECVARNAETDCCPGWGPSCAATAELCGLARATQDCVCQAQPACCSAERNGSVCAAAWAACNYLCPAFAASEASCLAPP